ncbi:MAG: pentapeptide repeat-containing protein, partial [Pseudomonadota bacterium]
VERMDGTTQFTFAFTLPTPVFYGLLAAAGLAIIAIAIHLIRREKPEPQNTLAAQFGLGGPRLPVFVIAAIIWTALALVLLSGLFGLIFQTLTAGPNDTYLFYVLRIAGLTTVLGAVIALPFTIIRLQLNQKQTQTAQESLFNDKINEATKGLYARRQVTKWHRKDGYTDHWQDDIVQRNAAIDRLEGLANEEPEEVPRIARLLSVYVRELSAEVPAQEPPKDATTEQIREWADALPKLRSDMEKAAQTLGRLANVALEPLEDGEIDLRGTNLQNADLNGLAFEKARLEGAQLQGAYLSSAQLQRADLVGAQLQGAYLDDAQLQGADLVSAKLQGADLWKAQFDAATSLTNASNRAASVREVDFTYVPQIAEHLAHIFGDASVTLPNGARPGDDGWPAHWATETLNWEDFETAWRTWQATLPEGWDKDIPKP